MDQEHELKRAYREEKTKELADILSEVTTLSEEECRAAAAAMFARYYRKERFGAWIRDDSYHNRDKAIYYCTCCNHWQSVKRGNQIQFMNYCPLCGARMDKPPL